MTTRTGRASQGKPIVATDPGGVYGFTRKRGLTSLRRQVAAGYSAFCKRRLLRESEEFNSGKFGKGAE